MSLFLIPACGDPKQISSAASRIRLTASSAVFAVVEGGVDPPDQIVTLESSGYRATSIGWTAMSDQPWLTVAPAAGTISPGQKVPLTLHVQAVAQAEGWIGATSTVGAPTAREDHDAVWTGDRMLLWGGEQGALLNTGGLYDPVLDQWPASTTLTGAPSPRTLHTITWTGTEAIVWGGSTGSQPIPGSTYYGDGYRYDPLLDSWPGTIATAGAPGARSLHTAVWTGSRMIVWGGYDGVSRVNTGGIYDPSSNTWVAATTTTNAPVPRLHHVAVWTGSEMIIWGGEGNSGDRNDGARYDPVLDQWTPITPAGAPAPRQAATAVWTGREMVVWGGSVLSGIRSSVNTGGRYNPALDEWVAATPTSGAPTARQGHGAVWTGSRMIVSHGASPTDGYFTTGGIYQPPIPAIGEYTATLTLQPSSGPALILLVHFTVTP